MVSFRLPRGAQLKTGLLQQVFRLMFGAENLRLLTDLDGQAGGDRGEQPHLAYPDYYTSQNFHGIQGGYLNPLAAVTYDRVTALASPPYEGWVRQRLINRIQGNPQTMLDLGCGTGSSTVRLKQAFPGATVTGLDLSPLMLAMAARKAQKLDVRVQWRQGLAEATDLPPQQYDLVTASFLFHEVPPPIAQGILQSCFRLVKPGGQVLILDGDQRKLNRATWLIRLFREPYSQVYAQGCTTEWMQNAGFTAVQTDYFGWIHQLTDGFRPMNSQDCSLSTNR